MKLSIILITNKNNIDSQFLSHISFADELVVVYDTINPPLVKKTSSSIKVSKISAVKLKSFSEKRNLGLSLAKGEWVLFVDDDEVVTKSLSKEILSEINNKSFYSGFYIQRKDVVFGQVLNHGEVGKTKLLRLAKRSSGIFHREVHETWKIKGKVSKLKEILYHSKNNFISDFLAKIISYGQLDSKELNRENKGFSYLKLLSYPVLKFINNYCVKGGFLDGYIGLFTSYLMSIQSLSVRVIQWEAKTE